MQIDRISDGALSRTDTDGQCACDDGLSPKTHFAAPIRGKKAKHAWKYRFKTTHTVNQFGCAQLCLQYDACVTFQLKYITLSTVQCDLLSTNSTTTGLIDTKAEWFVYDRVTMCPASVCQQGEDRLEIAHVSPDILSPDTTHLTVSVRYSGKKLSGHTGASLGGMLVVNRSKVKYAKTQMVQVEFDGMEHVVDGSPYSKVMHQYTIDALTIVFGVEFGVGTHCHDYQCRCCC